MIVLANFLVTKFYSLASSSFSRVFQRLCEKSFWTLSNTLVVAGWMNYLVSPFASTKFQLLATTAMLGGNIFLSAGSLLSLPIWNLVMLTNDVYTFTCVLYDVVTFNGVRHIFNLLWSRYLM